MDGGHTQAKLTDGILFSLVLGFASGIIVASIWGISPWIFFGFGIAGIIFGIFAAARTKVRAAVVCIFFFSIILGSWRFDSVRPDISYLADSIEQKVSVSGIIEEPTNKPTGQQFVLDTQRSVNIIVSTRDTLRLAYGDTVTVAEDDMPLAHNVVTFTADTL